MGKYEQSVGQAESFVTMGQEHHWWLQYCFANSVTIQLDAVMCTAFAELFYIRQEICYHTLFNMCSFIMVGNFTSGAVIQDHEKNIPPYYLKCVCLIKHLYNNCKCCYIFSTSHNFICYAIQCNIIWVLNQSAFQQRP